MTKQNEKPRMVHGYPYPYKVWPEDFGIGKVFSAADIAEIIKESDFPR